MCYGDPVATLYGDVILDRYKHPRYLGELDGPDAVHEDVNPLCGDRIRIEVHLDPGAGRRYSASAPRSCPAR